MISDDENAVDIVIATTGRQSLWTALLAALTQTYPGARTVVCGDGPQPNARAIFDTLTASFPGAQAIYRETPERFGHGNFVKEWWINHAEAATWLRFLDDDDWVPPYAIAEMMRPTSTDVSLVVCGMVVCVAGAVDKTMKYRICGGKTDETGAVTGTCLLRTKTIKGPYPTQLPADYRLALRAAAEGVVRHIDTPLYWYNGYRGGKTGAKRMTESYGDKWLYRHPHSFRKRLLGKVPMPNLLDDDGKLFRRAEDQAMFRPMARLARRTARMASGHYFYDITTYAWTPPSNETAAMRKLIIKRGFIANGEPCVPGVPPSGQGEIVFIVPCYRAASTIGRCVASLKVQAGKWRCIIAVDGGDSETTDAARLAIHGDTRFTVVVQPTRLYGLGNQLEIVSHLPDDTIVCQVDGDDCLIGRSYALAIAHAYADPDVEMTYGRGENPPVSEAHAKVLSRLHDLSVRRSAYLDERGASPSPARCAEIDGMLERIRPRISKAKKYLKRIGAPG